MDQYSVPIAEERTGITKIFQIKIRKKSEKPGRTLTVVWDARRPLIKGIVNRYSYLVKFEKRGSLAGNHYHKRKQELFFAVNGDFLITLEDIETKKKEQISLRAKDDKMIFIPSRIAHVVVSTTKNAILLVTATSAGTEADEFTYKFK